MEMRSFKQLAELTPQELAALTRTEAPTVAALGIGVGVDADQFETIATDPAATARMIVKAAKTRDAGGPVSPKPSTVAQQIIDAGKRRRAEG
jgi:hypothetical protein